MPIVFFACLLLLVSSTVLHYEALRILHLRLPALRIPPRTKLLVVMAGAFLAHGAEIALFGVAMHALIHLADAGSLGAASASFSNCMYLSAETYTSLGFGDLTPTGPVRMLAGTEALLGLLLIGWSASFTYLAMERFWTLPKGAGRDMTSADEVARP
ncbi:MAG: two pore domain potassium channel family protein [Proteobacteria bacterium]|nr:two pore domain potassium channel family protein [Pseudomonadota bacterium]